MYRTVFRVPMVHLCIPYLCTGQSLQCLWSIYVYFISVPDRVQSAYGPYMYTLSLYRIEIRVRLVHLCILCLCPGQRSECLWSIYVYFISVPDKVQTASGPSMYILSLYQTEFRVPTSIYVQIVSVLDRDQSAYGPSMYTLPLFRTQKRRRKLFETKAEFFRIFHQRQAQLFA